MTAVLSLLAATPVALAAEDPPREAPDGERVVLNGGHLDMAARLKDGRLEYQIKDGTVAGKPVWREPSDVLLHFDPRHELVIPPREEVPQFEGFGEPGESLWVDKDFEVKEGLLWPGWNTLEILPADVSGPVKVTFPKIEGPGRFILGQFEDDPEMGVRIGVTIDSTKPDPGSVELPANTHAHPLWIFNSKGVYRITMEMSTTLPSGEKVSDRETLAVAVGDVDPSAVVPGDGTPKPTPTPTPTPTAPPTGSASPTGTPTATPTVTATATATPTASPSPTPSASVTPSASASATPSGAAAPDPIVPPAGSGSSGAGTGSGAILAGGTTTTGGSLAKTGAGVALPAGIAAAAVVAGGATVLFVRLRRKAAAR
ncbi:choice-of-anchor M domain-containing protein [Streptomyces ficellus]|uniref:Choice-of-anchor M domain-containing protein n=1 Tax=Streptomyces ficellus TaxID=1977088 RepID=A0ABT7ZAI0_9ACTN|nr:choice-of-anchor M domain-containing protein [Streptomyces ficellus]MDN3296510.1 choice-of-anchor M domain-containing protein [Streptomyces ficellus]